MVSARPLCKCHAKPMWKNKSIGGWRCAVKTYRRNYIADRRMDLRKERERILEKLEELSGSE